uniref:proteasome endopeptidase complex n=1 Tax=Sinocyclocheilus rhinocerous TaxID=307959 RepID=A0A673IU14_9TELE
MALQDICGLHNPPLFPQWSAPLSRSFIPVHFRQTSLSSAPTNLLKIDHLHPSLPSISLPSPTPCPISPSVPLPFTLSHGTTTLGFAFQGGVIAAADTRSSCSGLVTGVSSEPLLQVTPLSCSPQTDLRVPEGLTHPLSPGRHHLQAVNRGRCQTAASIQRHGTASQPSCVDGMGMTQQVSKSRSRICGPRVIYVCSDGLRLQGELFSVGSGSPYACSILDSSVFWGMSVQEATEVAREAVFRTTYRDAYSGNNVDLYHVTAKGWRNEFHHVHHFSFSGEHKGRCLA